MRVRWDLLDVSNGNAPTSLAVKSIGGTEQVISAWAREPYLWPSDWVPNRRSILVTRQAANRPADLVEWPITDPPSLEPARVVLADPKGQLWQGHFSPDGRWLSFTMAMADAAVIGVTSAEGPPDRPWRRIAIDASWVDKPRWGRDGRTLYFLASKPSAYLNVFGIAFDSTTGVTIGRPFQLTDWSSPAFRVSPTVQGTEMSVTPGAVFLPMITSAGNIWMLDNVDR